MYPNADPWNWLVPDLVTALIRPPTNPPCRTSNGATRTWYSFTASIESGRAFTPPPGTWLLALSANRSLLLVPSIWMLLNRQQRSVRAQREQPGSGRRRERAQIVVAGAVDLDVVEPVVLPRDRRPAPGG